MYSEICVNSTLLSPVCLVFEILCWIRKAFQFLIFTRTVQSDVGSIDFRRNISFEVKQCSYVLKKRLYKTAEDAWGLNLVPALDLAICLQLKIVVYILCKHRLILSKSFATFQANIIWYKRQIKLHWVRGLYRWMFSPLPELKKPLGFIRSCSMFFQSSGFFHFDLFRHTLPILDIKTSTELLCFHVSRVVALSFWQGQFPNHGISSFVMGDFFVFRFCWFVLGLSSSENRRIGMVTWMVIGWWFEEGTRDF